MKNKGGQPAYYKTPEQMQKKIDEYFKHCEENSLFPNVIGLSLFLGFAGRQSLKQYEDRDKKFFDTIKSAKDRCYESKYQAAARGEINTTIFIFDAVNNHGMVNTRSESKNENKHSGGVTVNLITNVPD